MVQESGFYLKSKIGCRSVHKWKYWLLNFRIILNHSTTSSHYTSGLHMKVMMHNITDTWIIITRIRQYKGLQLLHQWSFMRTSYTFTMLKWPFIRSYIIVNCIIQTIEYSCVSIIVQQQETLSREVKWSLQFAKQCNSCKMSQTCCFML